jgi:hypothetical protein
MMLKMCQCEKITVRKSIFRQENEFFRRKIVTLSVLCANVVLRSEVSWGLWRRQH